MSTLLYNPYIVKWSTKGEGGLKKSKKLSTWFMNDPLGYLKKHILILHEGHKDYKCQSCKKSFTESGGLKRHIHIIHEGHKDHKCESCGKLFPEARNLKNHINRIHMN